MAIWTPDDEYNEAELEDLKLAIGLLTGVWTQQGADPAKKEADRYPGKRYFEGDLEKEARQAIGRLLRSNKPLDSAVRYQLAELFDGLPPHLSFDAAPMKRELVFGQRRAGKPNDDIALRNLHLASDYRTLIEAGTPRKRAPRSTRRKVWLEGYGSQRGYSGQSKAQAQVVQKANWPPHVLTCDPLYLGAIRATLRFHDCSQLGANGMPVNKLYQRRELPDLFEQAGQRRMTLSTLHKLHALGEGPPVVVYVGRIPFYDGDECIAWRKARIAAQTATACERQEANIKFRMKQLERMQRQAKAARESAAA